MEFGRMTAARWRELLAVWEDKERRADRRAALVASTMYNVMRPPKTPMLEVEDFMPQFPEAIMPAEEQTEDMLLQRVRMMNMALGGKEV